ncbi:MAG: DUF177 domain-containing protein [Actinomycetota bacterium]
MQQLIVPVAEILGRPGEYRDLELSATVADVRNALVRLDERPARATLRAESVVEGILVTGRVDGTSTFSCARCLAEGDLPVSVDVCDLFVTPERQVTEEDAYALKGADMDLEPLLRDALALALPLNPLCRADCKGLCVTCGRDLNLGDCDCTQEEFDPRWAALSSLRERLQGQEG